MARIALLACFASSVAGNAVDLTPDNFDKEVLQSGKAAFIKFLAPWCAPALARPPWQPKISTRQSPPTHPHLPDLRPRHNIALARAGEATARR